MSNQDQQQVIASQFRLMNDKDVQIDHMAAVIAIFSDEIDGAGCADWITWRGDMWDAGWEFSEGNWRKGGAIVPPSKIARYYYDGDVPTVGEFNG